MTAPAWRWGRPHALVFLATLLTLTLVHGAGRARDLVLLGDSAELVAAGAEWGVAHAPGYALWTSLARLAVAVPLGSIPARVNATSVLYHALAAGFVALAGYELTRSRAAAFGGALALACCHAFWRASQYAEVFPLFHAWLAGALLVGLRLRSRVTRTTPIALGALFGLGFAVHQASVLAAPLLLVWLAPGLLRARPAAGAWLGAALVFAAILVANGALTWLIAARGPQLSWGDVHDLGSLWRLLTRSDYGGLASSSYAVHAGPRSARVGGFALLLYYSAGPVFLLLALLGLLALVVTERGSALALLVGFLTLGPGFAALNGPFDTDTEAGLAFVERFVTASHLPLAVAASAGVAWLAGRFAAVAPSRWAGALVLFVVGVTGGAREGAPDLAADHSGRAWLDDVFEPLPDDAIVLVSGDVYVQAAQYACVVERRCQRRAVFAPGLFHYDWARRQTLARHADLAGLDRVTRAADSHEIVRAAGSRPVFVAPSLLVRDAEVADGAVPFGLLFRALAPAAPRAAADAEALSIARRYARGDFAAAQQRTRDLPFPSGQAQLLGVYEAALENHAGVATRAGDPALASALRARARQIAAPRR